MGNAQMYGKRFAEAEQYGNVHLDLNTDTFTPGDMVTGFVYVNIKNRYPGDKLCIKVKGKENTHWIDVIHHQRQKPDGTFESWTERVTREEERTLIETDIVLYDWANNTVLNPGQFSFPISFRVPDGLPGSFFYGAGEVVAEVYYGIVAYIQPENPTLPKIKHKVPVVLREAVNQTIQTREVSINKRVETGCCCCTSDQGPVLIKTMFEKDAYTPLERANAMIEVDNTQCKARISNVVFNLNQNITLRAQNHIKSFSYNVSSVSLGAIEPGQGFLGDQKKIASIQLPAMQMGRAKDMKRGTTTSYNYAPQSAIAPTSNGIIVRSTYSLMVQAYMEGCMCCDSNPCTVLPVQIYALVQKPQPKATTPPNWQPTVMPAQTITINITNNGGNGTQNISVNIQNGGMASNGMPQQQQNISVNINNNNNQPSQQPQGNPNMMAAPNQQQQPQYQPAPQQQNPNMMVAPNQQAQKPVVQQQPAPQQNPNMMAAPTQQPQYQPAPQQQNPNMMVAPNQQAQKPVVQQQPQYQPAPQQNPNMMVAPNQQYQQSQGNPNMMVAPNQGNPNMMVAPNQQYQQPQGNPNMMMAPPGH